MIWRVMRFSGSATQGRGVLFALLFSIPVWVMTKTLARLGEPHVFLLISLVVGPAMLVLLLRSQVEQRATLFETALPIAGRQLYLARTVSSLAAVGMLVVISGVVVAMRVDTDAALRSATLELGALATLAILIPQAIRVRDRAMEPKLLTLIWVMLALAGGLTCYVLPPGLALALFAAAIVGVFLRTWFSLPPSFQFAPLEPERSAKRTITLARRPAARAATYGWWWPVVRSAWSPYVPVLLMVLVAEALSGGTQLIIMLPVLVFPTVLTRQPMRWLSGLPLSHRQMLLITYLFPALITFCALPVCVGLSIAMQGWESSVSVGQGPHLRSDTGIEYYRSNARETDVPLTFWRFAPGGRLPMIQSPSGETASPASLSILGATLYNPYSAAKGNSKEFVRWQRWRATVAISGRSTPLAEYRVNQDPEGPPVTGQPRMLILSGAAFFALVLYVAFVIQVFSWHRLRRPSGRTLPMLLAVVVAAPLVLAWGIDIWSTFTYLTPVVVPMVQAMLLRAAPLLPQNLFLLAAVAALPVIVMYWLLEWQFGRSEPFIGRVGRSGG